MPEIAADLSGGYVRHVDLGEGIALLWYPDGSVGLWHLCTRPRVGLTLAGAPRLVLGVVGGHTLDEATLTVAPSCGCSDCGLHGWVRGGRWVPSSPLPVGVPPRC